MPHSFGSIDELGEGYGFRKVRRELGVTAFGVNAIVMPPGYVGFHHYHDTQDELYFVHSGEAHVEVEGEERDHEGNARDQPAGAIEAGVQHGR